MSKKMFVLFVVLGIAAMSLSACASQVADAAFDQPAPVVEIPDQASDLIVQADGGEYDSVTVDTFYKTTLVAGVNVVSNSREEVFVVEKYLNGDDKNPDGSTKEQTFGLVFYRAVPSSEYTPLGLPDKPGFVRGQKISKETFENEYFIWHYTLDNVIEVDVEVPAH